MGSNRGSTGLSSSGIYGTASYCFPPFGGGTNEDWGSSIFFFFGGWIV